MDEKNSAHGNMMKLLSPVQIGDLHLRNRIHGLSCAAARKPTDAGGEQRHGVTPTRVHFTWDGSITSHEDFPNGIPRHERID